MSDETLRYGYNRGIPPGVTTAWGCRGRCTFCTTGTPEWVVPTRGFTMPGFPQQFSSGDWSACDVCAELIKAEEWPKVLRRAIDEHQSMQRESIPTGARGALAWHLCKVLRDNMNGDLRRIGGSAS